MRTHVDLDQHLDPHAFGARRGVQIGYVARVVGQNADLGLAHKSGEARKFLLSHDLVRHEHVGDTARDQRLGLAHLLAAHADRPRGDLRPGDLGALVALRVRAQAHAAALHRVRHALEVALEGIQIENERGRVDFVEGDPDGGLRGRRHGAAILAIFTKTDGFAGAAADGTFLRQRTCHRVGNPFAWRIEP